jgi:hypothetical protein
MPADGRGERTIGSQDGGKSSSELEGLNVVAGSVGETQAGGQVLALVADPRLGQETIPQAWLGDRVLLASLEHWEPSGPVVQLPLGLLGRLSVVVEEPT